MSRVNADAADNTVTDNEIDDLTGLEEQESADE